MDFFDKIPACNSCKKPLVATMLFSSKEWYCLKCKIGYGFFGVSRLTPTERIIALRDKAKAKYDELTEGILVMGGYLKDCDKCQQSVEYGSHMQHATDEEHEASDLAYDRLENYVWDLD